MRPCGRGQKVVINMALDDSKHRCRSSFDLYTEDGDVSCKCLEKKGASVVLEAAVEEEGMLEHVGGRIDVQVGRCFTGRLPLDVADGHLIKYVDVGQKSHCPGFPQEGMGLGLGGEGERVRAALVVKAPASCVFRTFSDTHSVLFRTVIPEVSDTDSGISDSDSGISDTCSVLYRTVIPDVSDSRLPGVAATG